MKETRKIDELEVRKWIFRRNPGYKIATIDYCEDLHMWIAVIFANPACLSRLYIDVNEDGDLSVWEHEVCNWETIYRRDEE